MHIAYYTVTDVAAAAVSASASISTSERRVNLSLPCLPTSFLHSRTDPLRPFLPSTRFMAVAPSEGGGGGRRLVPGQNELQPPGV